MKSMFTYVSKNKIRKSIVCVIAISCQLPEKKKKKNSGAERLKNISNFI